MIFGISGTNSSGKDTVAKYLQSKDFFHVSLSDILREEMKKQKLKISRQNMIDFSNNYGQEFGADILAKTAYKKFCGRDKLIISSIRKPAEVDYLHTIPGLKLIFVDLPINIRYERMLKRARESENILSYVDFKSLQEKEMDGTNSQNLSYCKKSADYQIDNSGTVEELFAKIDEIIL
ncbi:MAG: AAA family ATPase [bacterium]